MNEAFEITRYLAKLIHKPVRTNDAKYLASFSFPLEEKLKLIRRIIEIKGAENIYSALYFSQAFIEAESSWHKGTVGEKGSSFFSVRDILASGAMMPIIVK